ncbi:long-chain-fatty-acid--CoA ligase [Paraconexibacter antarcticus]|uniref:Long-chain-fatty-acid--CoA ligase n=1 Tax=Paraconexibacter antarcticus TaxID=2949664 RepID=A0ABY5DXJ5_9ACTN|nr:long-chain-fatty-acid--CoA ligase [Paraconexibacter antarcticus]UTI66235.1 long-chain-fatty-acid--CoA ligase [Paraconexibacter antarcticus]
MDGNLSWVLDRATRIAGANIAVIDGDRRFTYRELDRRVAGLDAGLAALGIQGGDVVGVLALNSHRHFELWHAVPRGGAVLNDLNIRLAAAELRYILEDADTAALFVDDAFLQVGSELAAEIASIRHLIYAGDGVAPAGTLSYEELAATAPRPAPTLPPDALAGIFYTGGTTGRPKGAMLSHANLLANAKHVLTGFGYESDDRYLHGAPMFHLADGATTYALTWVGGTHVMVPTFDAALVAHTIQQERVTISTLVPTMINMLINLPDLDTYDLSSVRRLNYGASPMPARVLTDAMGKLDCEWAQAYGMTEASPLVTICSTEDHRRGAAGEEPYATRMRSAGQPVVGVQAEVRRLDGSAAEVGEPGEIWVRGPNVMQGYWRREEETTAALDAEGWYHSGDAAYLDADGYIFIVDRVKDMIISGGENVYSTEVENAIHMHPDVLEAAVFGIPDERWGERVHAVVVRKPGGTVDEAGIVEACRAQIAGFKLPRSVEFSANPLPKSGAGKVLKRDLREPHWKGMDRRVS